MDHSHHHHVEDAEMPMDMCSMNVSLSKARRQRRPECRQNANMSPFLCCQMLFTWDTRNLCIVFRWWHVRSTPGLFLSLLAVIALGVGYEALREGIRRYEVQLAKQAESVPRKPLITLLCSFFCLLCCSHCRLSLLLREQTAKFLFYRNQKKTGKAVKAEMTMILRQRLSSAQDKSRPRLTNAHT